MINARQFAAFVIGALLSANVLSGNCNPALAGPAARSADAPAAAAPAAALPATQPRARVYVFRNRLPDMHRDGWEGPHASNKDMHVWFVWERGHVGCPAMYRITAGTGRPPTELTVCPPSRLASSPAR